MDRLTYFENGHWRLDFNGCQYRADFVDRLAAYEDTGLTPESVEALKLSMMGKAISEIKEFNGLPVDRLRELAEADKEGRVAVLPCDVGGSMLDMSDIEHPEIMKRLHFAVAYDSSRGVVFYQPYDIFRANFDAAYIQPLSKETAAMLKEVQNGNKTDM